MPVAQILHLKKGDNMIIAEMLIPMHPNLMQMAGFCAAGFLLVMFVLAFQSVLTSLIGKIFTSIENQKK